MAASAPPIAPASLEHDDEEGLAHSGWDFSGDRL
jgi:hypothetical protein